MSYDHCKPVTTRRVVITDSSFVWWVGCSVNAVTLSLCLIAEGGLESHAAAPSGGYSNWEVHSSQPHHHRHPLNEVIDRSGWKTCSSCSTGYSVVYLGACPRCCPRESCKSGCGKPAFYTLDLGSFGYCSAECRDRCELERAKRELTRALEEFEVIPGRGSTQAPTREVVMISQVAVSQPLARAGLHSEDTAASESATPGSPPKQLPPQPQELPSVSVCNCKVPRDAVRDMRMFYDRGRLHTVRGLKGVSPCYVLDKHTSYSCIATCLMRSVHQTITCL